MLHLRKIDLQANTIKEGSQALFWIFTEILIVVIKGVIESTEYNALKVKNLKVEAQTK